jgi:hypothetical protein
MENNTMENKTIAMKPHEYLVEGKVLCLKCLNNKRQGMNPKTKEPFQYPESGIVEAPDWNEKPECGGGLHGWPYALGIGSGKVPDYKGIWQVHSVDPKDGIVEITENGGGKVKYRKAEIVYSGDSLGAIMFLHPHRIKYTELSSNGSASNSGYNGSASNSGSNGSASNSGYNGSASNSGNWGSASNSGNWGSASNSGSNGSASNSGSNGSASNSGSNGSASNSGNWGSASNSGNWGSASNSGYNGSASNSGNWGSASNSGNWGSASNSGYNGSASNSGNRGSASNSGYNGSASNSGNWGSAILCGGEESTIELSATSSGVVCANVFYWKYHRGATILQRWAEEKEYPCKYFDGKKMEEGKLYKIIKGEIDKTHKE